jgi:hypothetical protein
MKIIKQHNLGKIVFDNLKDKENREINIEEYQLNIEFNKII